MQRSRNKDANSSGAASWRANSHHVMAEEVYNDDGTRFLGPGGEFAVRGSDHCGSEAGTSSEPSESGGLLADEDGALLDEMAAAMLQLQDAAMSLQAVRSGDGAAMRLSGSGSGGPGPLERSLRRRTSADSVLASFRQAAQDAEHSRGVRSDPGALQRSRSKKPSWLKRFKSQVQRISGPGEAPVVSLAPPPRQQRLRASQDELKFATAFRRLTSEWAPWRRRTSADILPGTAADEAGSHQEAGQQPHQQQRPQQQAADAWLAADLPGEGAPTCASALSNPR
jgi:hypothetical protein